MFLTSLLLLLSLRAAIGKVVTDYWNGYKLLPPTVETLNTKSIPSCIHRCNIHHRCNILAVSVNVMGSDGFPCLLAWMECYEKYDSRIERTKGWDVYSFRDKGGLPFVLSYRIGPVIRMCTRISSTGFLVLSHHCHELFCKNSLNQIVRIETRQCLTVINMHSSGGDIAISNNCTELSILREVEQGVQVVKNNFHLHPQYSPSDPPEGAQVVAWYPGKYWFFFAYKGSFL